MSDLILIPDESPQDSPGTDKGYGKDPLGMTKDDCKAKAEQEGGYVWDEHAQACWMIFGKAIIIGSTEHSIEEGFKVTNFNFRANGAQPPVPSQEDLPGPVENGKDLSLTELGYHET